MLPLLAAGPAPPAAAAGVVALVPAAIRLAEVVEGCETTPPLAWELPELGKEVLEAPTRTFPPCALPGCGCW